MAARAPHKSTGNYCLTSQGHDLVTAGTVVDLDPDDPTVASLVEQGKLLPADADGNFPERTAVAPQPCCGGG